jgi:CelD/BcsL family acetyltransferase involved in cellulose biosynthesis
MNDADLVSDLASLESLAAEWDALAVTRAVPQSGPAWMLAWWHYAAPADAQLRVVAVRDHGELIGIAPFYTRIPPLGGHACYRLLADDFSASVTPLAKADREWEVAQTVAQELAKSQPRPATVSLAPLPASSPWATALRERWPGWLRPIACRQKLLTMSTISLNQPSFESWMATRSSHFRSNVRRYRRLFAHEGGSERLSTQDTVIADVQAFARLHVARWEGLGSSRLAALGEHLEPLLLELAERLLSEGRFRLLMLELGGQAICADLWISAGTEVVGVNIGWDERFKHLSPPRLSFVRMIEEGFLRGDRRLNFGWGRTDYKRSFANGNEAVTWDVLLPPGPQLPLALARAAPTAASRRVLQSSKRLLPEEQVDRLRLLRKRISKTRA